MKKVTSQAEPSQAENPSAQAMARACLARTHHYYIPLKSSLREMSLMVLSLDFLPLFIPS